MYFEPRISETDYVIALNFIVSSHMHPFKHNNHMHNMETRGALYEGNTSVVFDAADIATYVTNMSEFASVSAHIVSKLVDDM